MEEVDLDLPIEAIMKIEETPKGYINDYFVGTGTSRTSEAEAHVQALVSALQGISQSGEIVLTSTQRDTSTAKEIFKEGRSDLEWVYTTARELSIEGKSTTIDGLVENERYNETDGSLHTAWSLVRIPKKSGIESPPTKLSFLWRSALVPGWGQWYHGQKMKGYFIVGSEVLLIPGALIFQNLNITAQADAQNARTQALRDYYNDNANLYQNISLGALIAAGAIYAFNIVDAIVTEGNEKYVENSQSPFHYAVTSNRQEVFFWLSFPL